MCIHLLILGQINHSILEKEKNSRAFFHTKSVKAGKSTDNQYKDAVIRQILDANMEPIVQFIRTGLTEDDAYLLEKQLITQYGRKRFDVKGILTNLCEDGRPPK